MEIEKKNDLRLIGRAMREGWNVPKERVVEALLSALRDPDLMIDAAKLLIAADGLDIKREELEQKQHGDTEQRRLQLLAIAQRLPAGELAKLASKHVSVSQIDSRDDGG